MADEIREGNQLINNLKVGDSADFIITGVNKAGLISKLGSFEVFIPYSQISMTKVDNNLQNYVNKQFN